MKREQGRYGFGYENQFFMIGAEESEKPFVLELQTNNCEHLPILFIYILFEYH